MIFSCIASLVLLFLGRPGVAVMAFRLDVGHCDRVMTNYRTKHPDLLVPGGYNTYDAGAVKVLDVFAYYLPDSKKCDQGTVLRFIEFKDPAAKNSPLPGFKPEKATHSLVVHAYSDHWVSNVHDRKGFISTLQETLGIVLIFLNQQLLIEFLGIELPNVS